MASSSQEQHVRSDHIIVRPHNLSRLLGAPNPHFGTLVVGELRIDFVCDAGTGIEDQPGEYEIRPHVEGLDAEEEAVAESVLATHGLVLRGGRLRVEDKRDPRELPLSVCCSMIYVVAGNQPTAKLVATGGVPGGSYSIQLAQGSSLPDGLGLSSNADGSASITAPPQGWPLPPQLQTGPSSFQVVVSELGAPSVQSQTITCIIDVLPAPVAVWTPLNLAAGAQMQTSAPPMFSGGVGGPYTFPQPQPNLPNWLSIQANGAISGTQTATPPAPPAGQTSYSPVVNVKVQDGGGNTAQVSVPITIYQPVPLSVCCSTVYVVAGSQSTATLVGTGGSGGPYSIALASGSSQLPDGLTLASDGSGVITPLQNWPSNLQTGPFPFQVVVTDETSGVLSQPVTCIIEVLPAPTAAWEPLNLAAGSAMLPASPLAVSGGVGGGYSYPQYNLPSGLSVDSKGVISGIVSAAGPYPAAPTVTVKDGGGNTAQVPVPTTVNQPLALTLTTNPPTGPSLSGGVAVVGNPFSGSLTLSGGAGPNYTLSPQNSPQSLQGFTLNGNQQLSAPIANFTTATSLTLNIGVADASGNNTQLTVSIRVWPQPNGSWAFNQNLTVGEKISVSPQAVSGGVGGVGPFRFSAQNLPPGLTIDQNSGIISGTLTTNGSYQPTITITDPDGYSGPGTVAPITIMVSTPQAAGIARDKAELLAAVTQYTSASATGDQLRLLSKIHSSSGTLKSLLEPPARPVPKPTPSTTPGPGATGVQLSFSTELQDAGGQLSVEVFLPHESRPFEILTPDPNGDVYVPGNPGDVFRLIALLNEFPIQEYTLTAS